MDRVPESAKEEPKTTSRIPADGHGGKFYQFGWVDGLPQLLNHDMLPKTTYCGPSLEWPTTSKELKKALYSLHSEQDVFADVWKDATGKLGIVRFCHSRRYHSEFCSGRLSESIFGRLLDPQTKKAKEEQTVHFKEMFCGHKSVAGSEEDMEDHEPYSLGMMAQILCELSTELQEDSDEDTGDGSGEEPRLRLMRLRGQRGDYRMRGRSTCRGSRKRDQSFLGHFRKYRSHESSFGASNFTCSMMGRSSMEFNKNLDSQTHMFAPQSMVS